MNIDTRRFTATALLTAMAVIIPFIVVFKVVVPPFTATLGAHVPMFLSMFLGPWPAVLVGLGSALGFFLNLGPIVGARAFMHVFTALAGSAMLEKGFSYKTVVLITAPIHGLLEVLVILPFVPYNAYDLFIVTGAGTVLHHAVDAFIAFALLKVLSKTHVFNAVRTDH
ncbi:MAG: ECF transporter S component [Caldicoprobacterales bacterium]|jgi:niacin transporter|nr:ECF transporter S component [Clostridiales bacterium]